MTTTGAIIVALISAAAASASAFFLFLKGRGENKNAATNAKTALDALIDERVTKQLKDAWTRIDELGTSVESLERRETRRTGAITRILLTISNQWPSGTTGPNLDPNDIAEIEETIPSQWIRNRTPKAK